jgi:hypothetical protein
MTGTISSKFFWPDWRSDPKLRSCSLAARGLWMDMLCIAAEAQPTGYVLLNGRPLSCTDLARLSGAPEDEVRSAIAELDAAGVFSRDRKGRIYSRRMVRDCRQAQLNRKNGLNGGNPNFERGTVPKADRVRPFRSSDSPTKTEAIFQKSRGRCHWCGVQMVRGGDELCPETFHVDHLIPVRHGGTNDVGNLVGSCAKCNHARARKDWKNPPDTNPDRNSDTKAQGLSQVSKKVSLDSSRDLGRSAPARAGAREGSAPPDTPTPAPTANGSDSQEPLSPEERAEIVRRLEEVKASLTGQRPKTGEVRHPLAYQHAVRDAKRDAWLRDLHGWASERLAADDRMRAWEAIACAMAAGTREATPKATLTVIDQLDRLCRSDRSHAERTHATG